MSVNQPYNVQLTGDDRPTGAGVLVTELNIPHAGTILQLGVIDRSEDADGFTVDLYCSANALNEAGDAVAADDADLIYKVIPQQIVAASSRAVLLNGEYHYANSESTRINRIDKLYLVINASGSGTKLFDVRLLLSPPTTLY